MAAIVIAAKLVRANLFGELIAMVARTLAAFARRLRPAALGAACALVPPVMATAAVCSASDPLYPRRWIAAPGASNNGAPLRVVQFNILADGLSARHPSNGGFTESPPESLAWDFRRDRLVAEVFRHFEEEAGACFSTMRKNCTSMSTKNIASTIRLIMKSGSKRLVAHSRSATSAGVTKAV